MPFRKISGPEKFCTDPEHNPPSHYVLEKGCVYEWTCPGCGEIQIVTTPNIRWRNIDKEPFDPWEQYHRPRPAKVYMSVR
jgi:hypothetical protein